MKKPLLALLIAMLALSGVAAQPPDREALRARIEQRFDVVPIAGGLALTPKTRRGDVRLIEVSDAIAINGSYVSGSELRERLGSDADAVLQLSYLDVAARRALFARQLPEPPQPPDRPQAPERPVEIDPDADRTSRRSSGDRVRIFGNVTVAGDETVHQVVAVLGSVRVDGTVQDQVVSVLGGVELGPSAIVRGDVVSVGGHVRKASTAQVRGSITEIPIGHADLSDVSPWLAGVGLYTLGDSFMGVPRLIASAFRLLTLIILAALAYLLARRSVENAAERLREDAAKSTFIGFAGVLLIGPLMFMITIILLLTVIGIPLLVLMPVALLLLGLMALAGFSGAAYAIGQWASRRFGINGGAGVGAVVVGVIVILLPVMVTRVVGLGGWATAAISWPMAALAFLFELVVWSAGFGAVLSNTLTGWQARRAARAMTPPPAATA